MDFAQTRAAIISEHQAMERHDPHWKSEAAKGDKISERPIAFICDEELVFTGECVPKVFEGLKLFAEKAGTDKALQAREKTEPAVAQAIAKARRLLAGEQPAELRLSGQAFNCVSFALGEVGLKIVTTDGQDL